MIGEKLGRQILDAKLRELLTKENLSAILSDAGNLIWKLQADPDALDAVAAKLRAYLGVPDA